MARPGNVLREEAVLCRHGPGALAGVLAQLADRTDCYYVKYSVYPRDGMYLGRCFLTHEHEVGVLWAAYKGHPRLFCTIQDDEFTAPFRP